MEKVQLRGEQVFLIRGFLSEQECESFITRSESFGYEEAPITTSVGFVMRKDVRDNARVVVDDVGLADDWFARARDFLPADWFQWALVGLNERFRYYRYDPGQRFVAHTDGYFERLTGERSHLTFMVYLNDGFQGGETKFHISRPALTVVPERGTALVFAHRQVHEGAPVIKGRKYVLRTDVMYRKKN